jgi:hypothetical protein
MTLDPFIGLAANTRDSGMPRAGGQKRSHGS